jgi:polysaccharide transporter, PST family
VQTGPESPSDAPDMQKPPRLTSTPPSLLSVEGILRPWISPSGRQVARNAFYLYVIQFMDYIVPMITVPYLVRVLGPERYGTLGFAQGFIALLSLFVDYGFILSATRRVSVQRNDLPALSRTAASVWAAKLLLALLGGVVTLVVAGTVPRFQGVALLLLLLYGRLLGNVLSPLWLFQGMERMSIITGLNSLNSVVVMVCIFVFIHRPSDYVLLAGIQGVSALLTGLLAWRVAVTLFRLRLPFPSPGDILHVLREGFALFVFTSCVSLYTTANSVILGLLTNDRAVGYYVAAEKLVGAVRGLMSPIAQAAYPRLSKLASESRERALYWGRYVLLVMGGTGAILCAGLLVSAPLITHIFLGPEFGPTVLVMRLLAPLTILVGLSNVFGIQIMLPLGWDKAFTTIIFCAGVLNLALAFTLAPRWEAAGMAGSVLLSELFVTVAMPVYLLFHRVNPFTGAFHAAQPR